MSRLILLILFGLTAAFYFPDSRVMLLDVLNPVVAPIQRWNTKDEMRRVARDVVEFERTQGRVPDRRAWLDWLEWRYVVQDTWQDPWGSTYELVVYADSVGIVSYGPDRTKLTEDDFSVVMHRTPPQGRRY